MRDLKAHRNNQSAAVAAAVIVWLQAFFTAWGMGAAAAHAMPVDAFGNPLCITAPDETPPPAGGPAKVPDCCTMGCSLSAAALPAPGGEVSFVLRFEGGTAVDFTVADDAGRRHDDHAPGSPRAPPPTV